MNLWGVESVHLFFFKAGEKSNDLVLEENQRLPTTAWNVSSFNFIYLFILPSCFNPWSLKAKNECNVLENEEHVTVSKKETKGKGVCVLGSLVRRHIKAIQLIDEAFHKWRVKVCMSLFICLFFFLNCCLSLSFTFPCFPIMPLLLWSLPTGHTSLLNWRECCCHSITKSSSALLRTAESVLQQALVEPATVRPSKETKMPLIPVRLRCWFILVLEL